MSEAGTTTREDSTIGLAGQIDALLAGMQDSAASLAADQASAAIDQSVGVAGAGSGGAARAEPVLVAAEAGEPLSASEVESLSDQIDSLVDEVEAAAPIAGPSSAQGAEGEPAREASEGSAGVSTEAEDASIDLGELDAHLAAQAARTEPEPQPERPSAAAVLPAPTVVVTEATRAPVQSVPVAAAPVIAADVSTGAESKPGKSVWARVASGVWSAMGGVRPALTGVAGLSSRALEASPKLARETAGWIGLVTVFFACCMWAIILFFRTTPTPEVYGVASDVLEHGDPTPQPRPRPHVAAEEPAGGGHGAPAAGGHGAPPAAAGHGAPPAAHGKPAADAHGGGH